MSIVTDQSQELRSITGRFVFAVGFVGVGSGIILSTHLRNTSKVALAVKDGFTT